MKDSRSITTKDRILLKKEILEAGFKYNLVTHGTYTMKKTAAYLSKEKSLKNQVIGVTGSMYTLIGTIDNEGRLMPSDAQFNLGYSFGRLPLLQNGVYQFMAGETFLSPEEWWQHDSRSISWKKNRKITTHRAE